MAVVAEETGGHPGNHNNQMKKVKERIPATYLQTLAMKTVCQGSVPKHVAFIMDGNRRYARENGLKSVSDGHRLGRESLNLMVDRCFDMGVTDVTVYALSIENFKRSKAELAGLFALMHEELDSYFQHEGRYYGVRMIGDISRFPPDLQAKLAKYVMEEGTHYTRWLNVCVAYTSRVEITDAIKDLQWGVRKGFIRPEDVNESLLESCFWSTFLPPVDLLIRTSGEIRLSDFLLWQAGFCPLVFTETLWPDMNCWSLLKAFIVYQRNVEKTERERQLHLKRKEREEELYLQKLALTLNEEPTSCLQARKTRVNWFLQNLAEKRHEELRQFASGDVSTTNSQMDNASLNELMDIYTELQQTSLEKSFIIVKNYFLDTVADEGPLRERMEKMIHYNMIGTAIMITKVVVHFLQRLCMKATPEQLEQIEIIGWLVGFIGIAIQIEDDIVDNSKTRCSKPCWYLVPGVGKTAVMDTVVLRSFVRVAINHFFKNHVCSQQIYLEMNKIIMVTNVGAFLDTQDNHKPGSDNIDLEKFTWERFNETIPWKVNISHYMSLVLYVAGETNEEVHKETRKYSDHFSCAYQAMGDFNDVFPGPGSSMGTDIQEGRLTWMMCKALDKASPEQKKILAENYGKRDKKCVRSVKKVFQELDLKKNYEEVTFMPDMKPEDFYRLMSETKEKSIWADEVSPLLGPESIINLLNAIKQNFVLLENGLKIA